MFEADKNDEDFFDNFYECDSFCSKNNGNTKFDTLNNINENNENCFDTLYECASICSGDSDNDSYHSSLGFIDEESVFNDE